MVSVHELRVMCDSKKIKWSTRANKSELMFLLERSDFVKDLMSIRYFYCSSKNCRNMKEDSSIFCMDHTIYNCIKLRSAPMEIPREIVKKLVLASMEPETICSEIQHIEWCKKQEALVKPNLKRPCTDDHSGSRKRTRVC